MMGAFEPPPPSPPPKEPLVCSACPVCVACPWSPAPMKLIPTSTPSTRTLSVNVPHSYVGFGGFVQTGMYRKLNAGPYLLLGFGVSNHWSNVRIEFQGSWASQQIPDESGDTQSIPLVGSVCLLRNPVRFCGGGAATVFYSNQALENNKLKLSFGPSFRIGTEWVARGRFSLRGDIFIRSILTERRFDQIETAMQDGVPIAGGLAVIGV